MTDPEIRADLLVIGGGIEGVAIAQDAAVRGLKTVLVEKADFASGTSSKSSKLVHGGLRYLGHLSLGLTRESISERHVLAGLPSTTDRLRIGTPRERALHISRLAVLPPEILGHLLADYGERSEQIAAILEANPEWERRMVPELPYILAEAQFAVRCEKARTLEDVLARRTRVTLLARDRGRSCMRAVCEILKTELGWSAAEVDKQIENYEAALRVKFSGPDDLK